MTWNPLVAFSLIAAAVIPSFLISLVATAIVRANARKWGLVDEPNDRKVHVTPTPLGGGIGIWVGLVGTLALAQLAVGLIGNMKFDEGTLPPMVASLVEMAQTHFDGFVYQSLKLWALVAGASILMIIGLIDDRIGLSWKIRLAVQTAVAAVFVIGFDWKLSFYVDIVWLQYVVSILWIVAMINSFNMLDNMDGLSAGVATIAASIMAAVLLIAPDPSTAGPQLFTAGFLLVLTGAMLGFLWHNRPPAKIFMGDAGSYLIGFCIAIMTIIATFAGYDEGARHAVLAPLCILAVPLFDLVTVIAIRLREGRSPFQPDKCHVSHRLVELGFTKTQAVLTIYLMTATCGLGAVLLHRVDWIGAVVVLLMVFCVLALIGVIESTARRSRKDP
ncbi:undecaprenyl/decaprenyl-phosphate alpha-N-acetylglucosaminyl 1-phosphate transferase [Blastopirellula sp. JC732]|uniref:Undecaprenyl/decaprenyl-phosphate alpha-N-acetylglucosaminyl 1-phosphate transferase n=1 Tax=Blastopirellula sediminis TaxID=2894196 RepID=A0A9X1MQ98_9BACT|nr:MraY family glycosyltransferase [Blastopirellula sediminis]MCC9605935.1 undecaprenyl/decaprenyl-phosphate alpha-N-acetylglucosaminyl 1-phosphate transferase [Blastopirellula sediminis]MCC9630766.1 undecaprenyl/decaprenyl-phosphate alpha-N-acetylglucosaminyl 1-phosphate transferase [Blastopirellula sediminis]